MIEPRNLYNRGQRIAVRVSTGKADAVNEAEGSRPGCARASVQDTTGVKERGMKRKEVTWELGRATCLLVRPPETAYRVTKQARR